MTAQQRERYSRQILFSGIGEEGQERLCDPEKDEDAVAEIRIHTRFP